MSQPGSNYSSPRTFTGSPPTGQPARKPKACLVCKAGHLRCDGAQPSCSRCLTKKVDCAYPQIGLKTDRNSSRPLVFVEHTFHLSSPDSPATTTTQETPLYISPPLVYSSYPMGQPTMAGWNQLSPKRTSPPTPRKPDFNVQSGPWLGHQGTATNASNQHMSYDMIQQWVDQPGQGSPLVPSHISASVLSDPGSGYKDSGAGYKDYKMVKKSSGTLKNSGNASGKMSATSSPPVSPNLPRRGRTPSAPAGASTFVSTSASGTSMPGMGYSGGASSLGHGTSSPLGHSVNAFGSNSPANGGNSPLRGSPPPSLPSSVPCIPITQRNPMSRSNVNNDMEGYEGAASQHLLYHNTNTFLAQQQQQLLQQQHLQQQQQQHQPMDQMAADTWDDPNAHFYMNSPHHYAHASSAPVHSSVLNGGISPVGPGTSLGGGGAMGMGPSVLGASNSPGQKLHSWHANQPLNSTGQMFGTLPPQVQLDMMDTESVNVAPHFFPRNTAYSPSSYSPSSYNPLSQATEYYGSGSSAGSTLAGVSPMASQVNPLNNVVGSPHGHHPFYGFYDQSSSGGASNPLQPNPLHPPMAYYTYQRNPSNQEIDQNAFDFSRTPQPLDPDSPAVARRRRRRRFFFFFQFLQITSCT